MIGDELLLERFHSLFDKSCTYHGEIPFSNDVLNHIAELRKIADYGGEEELYRHTSIYQDLWIRAITDSIVSLRKNDKRELRNPEDVPSTFGVEELLTYFKDYTNFEATLYGSTKYYRDHVLHVVRVWLLGIYILTEGDFIKRLKIGEGEEVDNAERFAMWTIIALTHDLGYPLEKASQVISGTRNMMRHFITNPVINMDFKFTGVQDTMNDFIIKLMSSKMAEAEDGTFRNHIQSKYYFKFLKSLEDNKHGVLSAIVIYKMLEYFLESEFNLSDDYKFTSEDKRQFYIRRDILRAISSHTCESIYQNDILKFSFLLILCDECQEWGRRSFATMYGTKQCEYELKDVTITEENANQFTCSIKESYSKVIGDEISEVSEVYCSRIRRQFNCYSKWFRDGQNIQERNFTFRKEVVVEHKNSKYGISAMIEIDRLGRSSFILNADNKEVSRTQNIEEFAKIFKIEFSKALQNKKPM